MLPALSSISALLISVAFLLLGHGLLLTLLPISASNFGFNDAQVAFTGSAYFLGFVSGCIATPYILKRVGHIRSFAVLATSYSIVILVLPWLPHFIWWLILRFLIGATISGLYMISESWLNEKADKKNRGSILSTYTMLTMIMIMCGQQLLNLKGTDVSILFGLAAIFVSLAIIPVSLTLSLAPSSVHHVKVNFPKVWQHSHVAILSAMTSGMVTGAYWSLAPIYAKENHFDTSQLTAFITASVLGGACFQWPLGKLSDSYDRRLILMYMAFLGGSLSLALAIVPNAIPNFAGWPATLTAFFWGGACMTIYSIGLAHANDNAGPSDFVEIGSVMLITIGLFSAIGAPLASFLMKIIGAEGLYAFASLCLFCFFFTIIIRRKQHVIEYDEETHENFRPISDMVSPEFFEVDPRSETPIDSEEVDLEKEDLPSDDASFSEEKS